MKANSSIQYKGLLKKAYLIIRKTLLIPFLLLRRIKDPAVNEIKEILVIRNDGVGDMVISTPVFKALKKKYPSARLTVVASSRNHEVIQGNPYVDDILIYKGAGLFMKEMRTRKIDLAIDLFITYRMKQAFITYLSGASYRLGFEESGREMFFNIRGPAASYKKKAVENLFDLVGTLGAGGNECEPEIFLETGERQWALNVLSERGLGPASKVAIHPGAFYPIREWPAERFGEVAKRIVKENGPKILLFEDRKEKTLLGTIQNMLGERAEVFCGLQLRQFMSLLSWCDLLICNNSGPLHIAAALKVPTVSIVGPSIVPLWLPYGSGHVVIRKELPCSPCNKVTCEDHSCMRLITAGEVTEAALGLLGAKH